VFVGMWQGAGAQDSNDVMWSRQINKSGFYALKLSPDNKIVTASTVDDTSYPKIIILDTAGGKLIKELYGHKAAIGSLSFSPDGKYLASGSEDTTIRIWNVETGLTEKILFKDYPDKRYMTITASFTNDGKYLIALVHRPSKYVGNQRWILPADIFVWRTDTWEITYNTVDEVERTGLTISTNSDYFATFPASFYDFDITLYSMTDFQPVGKLVGHGGYINSLAFSHDGKFLASSNQDQTIRIWDVKKLIQIKSIASGYKAKSIIFSPDSRFLIIGSGGYLESGKIVSIIDLNTEKTVWTYSYDGNYLDITNNGNYLFLNNRQPYMNILMVKTHWEPSGINKTLKDEDISVFPNPSKNQVVIQITSNNIQSISIKIKDLNGKQVKDLYNGTLFQGKNEFNWETNDVSSGIYFVEISSGKMLITKQINVIK